eukprot:TRINITY_DN26933_c0_g1_i1.p1 TRINITY_DN26933_c0_g1~~TRINITY_DN26933_c0_g1_i1.p1  ORF type:complete len:344 (+),score=94.15 TRINITY_DN26933_c0_g1_i1:94-1125(+)
MAEIQKRLDNLVELYLNEHSEKEQEVKAEVDALFKECSSPEATINLFKHLPTDLTIDYIVKVLEIEKAQLPSAGLSKQLRPTIMKIDFSEEDEKKRAVLLVHDCLQAKDNGAEAQAVLLEFLSLFEEGATGKEFALEELAAKAVLGHFKHAMLMGQQPTSWEFDTICNLHPVRSLRASKNKQFCLLYSLLRDIFAAGKCSEYMSFYAENKSLIEETWGLDSAILMNRVRILALCTLCTENATVSYNSIAQGLCVEPKEVERYLIDAMSLNLLSGKIDSMAGVVHVKAAHYPLLETSHWSTLRHNLLAWYTQVSKLVATLDDVRIQQVKEDRESERIEANSRAR